MRKYTVYEKVNPAWFGNDPSGVEFVVILCQLGHIWDDLIDRDCEVSNEAINNMMRLALVALPLNLVYRKIQHVAPHFISTIISSYETANLYEENKDEKGLEIGHVLRYSIGQLIAYAIEVCVGPYEARKYIPEMWKLIVFENLEEYRKEHLNA